MNRRHRARERTPQRRSVRGQPHWVSLLIVLILLVACPGRSWGHSGAASGHGVSQDSTPGTQVPAHAVPQPQPPPLSAQPLLLLVPLLFLTAFGLWKIGWRWREAAALSLTLLLGLFAFQTGFHAVHHLSNPQTAAQCPVFSASQHITGVPAGTSNLFVPTLAPDPTPTVSTRSTIPARFFRPDQGRAPPSPLT